MTNWNEAEHPRDEDGKFTYKNGGGSGRSHNEKMQNRADILYQTMKDKYQKANYDKIGIENSINNNQSREDIFYPSMKNISEEQTYTGTTANLKKSPSCYNSSLYEHFLENLKETDLVKKYKNDGEYPFNEKYGKYMDIELEWNSSNNAKFSDIEIKKARNFIQGVENFRADAHKPTPNDVWTIGYGHTGLVDGKPIKEGMVITREKAEELYRKDFETHTKGLKNIQVPLTSNQKIALASFMYNLGPNIFNGKSNLLDKLNSGDIKGASIELEKYNKQRNNKTGKFETINGLVNRRRKEKELFLKPDGE